MSGTLVIWSLLAHDSPLLAVVPLARIKEGEFLPVGLVLPAIEIKRVDGVPRTTLAMTEPGRLHRERVQVTPLFKGVGDTPAGTGKKGVDAALKLIRAACPNQRGTIAGVTVRSIVVDLTGPDVINAELGIYGGSQDFIVTWAE